MFICVHRWLLLSRFTLKKTIFALLYYAGLTRLASRWNRKRVTILCYHGVTERADRSPDDPSGLHVRLDRFRSQLDYLERHHRVLSLSDYLKARREGKPLPDYSVVLTFDDGYRNFFTVVAPCLIESGLPASVFLITDRIVEAGRDDRNACWTPDDDRAFLSWGEVSELEKMPGIYIGSHTCSHAMRSSLSARATAPPRRKGTEGKHDAICRRTDRAAAAGRRGC